jgi:hypothetical protein
LVADKVAVSVPKTDNHISMRFGTNIKSRMTINKKQLVGITTVVLTLAYSLRRWRSDPPELTDNELNAEQTSPAAD